MPVFDNLSLISILLMAVQFFIVVSVVIRVILTRHPPGSSFAWILLTVVLPYVGFFLYLMLGERPIGRLRARLLRHATHYWGRLSQVRSPPLGPLPYHLVRHRTYIHLASKLAGMPVMGGSAVSLKPLQLKPSQLFKKTFKTRATPSKWSSISGRKADPLTS